MLKGLGIEKSSVGEKFFENFRDPTRHTPLDQSARRISPALTQITLRRPIRARHAQKTKKTRRKPQNFSETRPKCRKTAISTKKTFPGPIQRSKRNLLYKSTTFIQRPGPPPVYKTSFYTSPRSALTPRASLCIRAFLYGPRSAQGVTGPG